jgi:hypothetical protein
MLNIHLTASRGTFSVQNVLKVVIEMSGWGACGLSIEDLSGVEWLGGKLRMMYLLHVAYYRNNR